MRAYFLMCNCKQRTTLMYVILMYSKGTYAKKGEKKNFSKDIVVVIIFIT